MVGSGGADRGGDGAPAPEDPAGGPTVLPGRYRHYRSPPTREYEVLFEARHSETEEVLVVYRALYGEHGVWVRPKAMWLETVEVDGVARPRFARVDEA